MEDDSSITKSGFEISEELKRRFKSTAAQRGIKMREALRQAIEAWLSAPIPTEVKKLAPPEGSTGVVSMSLLEFSSLNGKLNEILELLAKHGKEDHPDSVQHRLDPDERVAELAEKAEKFRRTSGKSGRIGKRIRRRSQKVVRPTKTGSDS